jgi:hypothetical protein
VARSAARWVAATLAASLAATGVAACGGHRPRSAALRIERADLVEVAHTLTQLRAPVAAEAAAAREAWPSLASGLPHHAGPMLRTRVAGAARLAATLTLPAAVLVEGYVTGPAASLAGMLKSYVRLSQRGWGYLAQALSAQVQARSPAVHATTSPGSTYGAAPRGAGGDGATVHFLRANAPLYIYCVYDGHYNLSLVGKTLLSAYGKLGGAPAFGGSLKQSEVEALARSYSIPEVRLQPHPAPNVVV